MVMSVCGYAQKYEVGTTTAVWKAPAAADFLHAKAIGVKEGKCRFYGRDDRIVCHVPTDLPGFASKFGTDSRQYSGATDCQCFGVYCLFEEIC